MKEELTRAVIEAMSMCSHNVGCKKCAALYFCNGKMWPERCKWLATALLEEMDRPKVWDGAPEDALQTQITWFTKNGGYIGMKTYTRELPKTRARQIAEKEGHRLAEIHGWNAAGKELVTNAMESAINKYADELKGKE